MSRLVRCVRALQWWGRNFDHGEEVDVTSFAETLSKDPDWLYAKMVGPMRQVGMELVPCFEATTGGGAEEDELSASGTGPPVLKEVEETSNEEGEGEVSYPDHLGYGRWKLSDGSKFRGKKPAAFEAQAALDAGTPVEAT